MDGFYYKGQFKSGQLGGGAQYDWAIMACGKTAKATLIF
jgi:hypothetical protein